MSEKLKTQQRDNELETLSHELEIKVLNQENAQLEAADSRFVQTAYMNIKYKRCFECLNILRDLI